MTKREAGIIALRLYNDMSDGDSDICMAFKYIRDISHEQYSDILKQWMKIILEGANE